MKFLYFILFFIFSYVFVDGDFTSEMNVTSTQIQLGERTILDGEMRGSELSGERELYGIIEEQSLLQLVQRLTIYLIIVLVLSSILTIFFLHLQKTKNTKEIKYIVDEVKEEDIFQKFFGELDESDTSQVFIRKYLKASEDYLTERSASKQNYNPLTLEEMKRYKSFQTYALKNDFETLYKIFYSSEILPEEEKVKYKNNLKKYFS